MPHEPNEGGQAFPQLNSTGMTLRDWFAGQALVGNKKRLEAEDNIMLIARVAYEIADAMIEVRKE